MGEVWEADLNAPPPVLKAAPPSEREAGSPSAAPPGADADVMGGRDEGTAFAWDP